MASRFIVYGRTSCPFCKMALDILDQFDMQKVFFDFTEDQDAIEEAKQLSERNKQLEHIEQIRKTGGGFDQKLVAAFEHADNGNKGKLALVFPELFGHLVD